MSEREYEAERRGSLQAHWEGVYQEGDPTGVSWYQPTPQMSLELIDSLNLPAGERVLDVGAGASALPDGLLERGLKVQVLDLSARALELTRERLGARADAVTWQVGNVLSALLGAAEFAVWHDRAVFHFLTDGTGQQRYVAQAAAAVQIGGYAIIATFAPDGPQKCSGLPVQRYSAAELAATFAPSFVLRQELRHEHVTPSGAMQPFTFVLLERVNA
ncbi:class I SAM-dependent methyltransferase [Deinococcus sp. SL84]|uniref:class I SAM-dependent methyltransferase n=1 Tax=Deinococcus sp. SL84 TaxID=2994663 RepID=UPI0022748689|nr:class I SAM-dependent methyltransferase [Deinococcus sp. SL84]MCY1703379.1 class I SAM-dependent methyltransferase [Deinococcus sp. SL84]